MERREGEEGGVPVAEHAQEHSTASRTSTACKACTACAPSLTAGAMMGTPAAWKLSRRCSSCWVVPFTSPPSRRCGPHLWLAQDGVADGGRAGGGAWVSVYSTLLDAGYEPFVSSTWGPSSAPPPTPQWVCSLQPAEREGAACARTRRPAGPLPASGGWRGRHPAPTAAGQSQTRSALACSSPGTGLHGGAGGHAGGRQAAVRLSTRVRPCKPGPPASGKRLPAAAAAKGGCTPRSRPFRQTCVDCGVLGGAQSAAAAEGSQVGPVGVGHWIVAVLPWGQACTAGTSGLVSPKL